MASYIDLNDLGSFANIEALWAAHPEGGQEGDYCTIDGVKYRWDKYDRMWVADPNFGPTPARSVTTFDGDVNMQNNLTVAGTIRAKGVKQPCMGFFLTLTALTTRWPKPEEGWWAIVGNTIPGEIYRCDLVDGVPTWVDTETTGGPDDIDLSSITITGIRRWLILDNTSELPAEPTEDEKSYGYLIGAKLYVFYGEGGDSDTPGQQYKGVDITGPPGVGFASVADKTPNPDGTVIITLTNGDTITLDLNHDHAAYPKYELVSSLPASPDSGTLYLIAAT